MLLGINNIMKYGYYGSKQRFVSRMIKDLIFISLDISKFTSHPCVLILLVILHLDIPGLQSVDWTRCPGVTSENYSKPIIIGGIASRVSLQW